MHDTSGQSRPWTCLSHVHSLSTRYSSLSFGPLMTLNRFTKSPETHRFETRSYLIIHPVIPLLHFLLLLHGPNMSQFTCLIVHIWVGGHFQHTETRYLMVIIPEVPNVISGTEISGFFFFRKWFRGQEYPLQRVPAFPDFPWFFIYIYLTEKKSKKGGYSAGQWSNTKGQGNPVS